jgi:hypothetical protein
MLATDLSPSLRDAISEGEVIMLDELEGGVINQLLIDKFPFSGTFVDWEGTANHRRHYELSAAAVDDLSPRFFREHLSARRSEPAFYANDGVSLKLRATVAVLETHLQAFIELPHTSYFLAVDGSWCLSLRMNGDMDFGECARI